MGCQRINADVGWSGSIASATAFTNLSSEQSFPT
jgi:hypothetical protein